MATFPILHDVYDSIRFGRVLFAEIAPGPDPPTPCRYCSVLDGQPPPSRAHFSNPESCARAILDPLGKGEAPERIVLGGPGDPLRELGIGSLLRRLRTAAHLGTVILTDGALLHDRDARRDTDEAEMVVAWLPALTIPGGNGGGFPHGRRQAIDRHIAGIAALRRESRAQVAVEIEVRPGENDNAESIAAWRRAVEVIRPHRTLIIPPGPDATPEIIQSLERVLEGVGSGAGVALVDPTPVDRRCYCDPPRR